MRPAFEQSVYFRSGLVPTAHKLIKGLPLPREKARSERLDMRILSVVLVIWLVIGAIAGAQRHYYTAAHASCAGASTIAVTVLAGPLNYAGANPRVNCPEPSK